MLSQEVEERLAEHLVNRIEEANTFILKKIGETLKYISTLSPSQAYQLGQILKYGGSYNEIAQELARISGRNVQDMYTIFDEVAKNNKQFAKQFYEYRNIDFVPYSQDSALQKQVRAIATMTADTYRNISNTSVIGLMENGEFRQLQEAYRNVIDKAILSVTQGKQDYYSTMRDTLKELGGNGLVQYESGRTRRLDSAVRMNLLDGMRQLNNEMSKKFGEEYGADGVEISVHAYPAPDHADIQGRQFSNEEYEKLENGEVATSYNGIHYDGADKRQISQYNCYHKIFTIVLGVSKPEYTDEQLEKIQQENKDGFEFEGKHYTMYEGTQLQRQLELAARKQKDTQILAKSAGDMELVDTCQKKLTQINYKYNELNKASGLKPKKQRMTVSGYKRMAVPEDNIQKQYITQYDAIYSLDNKSNEWWNKLDRDEQRAIYRYTGGLNVDINEYLNGNINLIDKNMLPIVKESIPLIDKGLSEFKLDENIITYRKAFSGDIFGTGARIDISKIDKYKNNIITNKGFTSTSLLQKQAEKFRGDTFITFKIPKNTKGAYLGDHSNIPEEREFLLTKNSKYIINNISSKNGQIYIDATILN